MLMSSFRHSCAHPCFIDQISINSYQFSVSDASGMCLLLEGQVMRAKDGETVL